MLGLRISLPQIIGLVSSFKPSDISDLDLWYDFSTVGLIYDDGVDVANWKNSGEGGTDYSLTAEGSKEPVADTVGGMGTLNSVRFSGSRFNMDNPYLTTGKTYTLFGAYKRDDLDDTDTLFSSVVQQRSQYGLYSNANAMTICGSGESTSGNTLKGINCNNTSGGTVAYEFTTNIEVLLATVSDTTVNVYNQANNYIGTGTLNTNGTTDTNFQAKYIGSTSTSGSAHETYIGELGIYNKVLSTAERGDLIGYLKGRWVD